MNQVQVHSPDKTTTRTKHTASVHIGGELQAIHKIMVTCNILHLLLQSPTATVKKGGHLCRVLTSLHYFPLLTKTLLCRSATRGMIRSLLSCTGRWILKYRGNWLILTKTSDGMVEEEKKNRRGGESNKGGDVQEIQSWIKRRSCFEDDSSDCAWSFRQGVDRRRRRREHKGPLLIPFKHVNGQGISWVGNKRKIEGINCVLCDRGPTASSIFGSSLGGASHDQHQLQLS